LRDQPFLTILIGRSRF